MARLPIRTFRRGAIAAVAVIATFTLLWEVIFWLTVLEDHWAAIALTTTIATGIAIAAAPLVWAIWWLWWRLPKRQVRSLDIQIEDPKARADAEDNFRKTIGQGMGGAAVLIGAAAAYLQIVQQQQASHDLLISNQVSKGFEQLANKEPIMRLGGIYALEGVMNGSEQYSLPVLEGLCAFVRDITKTKVGTDDPPTTEIQAALTVIGRRHLGGGVCNLRSTVIAGANLMLAHLVYADLTNADLRGSNLMGANLTSAKLSGATLSGADLSIAHLNYLDLGGVNLSGARLDWADLSHSASLPAVQLDQACGTHVTLPGGDVRDLKRCPVDWKPTVIPLNRSESP
jgi:hypothetical protein